MGRRTAEAAQLAATPGIITCPPDRIDDLRARLPGRDIRVDPDLHGVITVHTEEPPT